LKKSDLIPALIWLGLGIAVAVGSYRLELGTMHTPGPGLMPFILGVILSLCSLPILVRSIKMTIIKAKKRNESIWSGVEFKKLIVVLVSLIGYAVLIERIGYVVITFLVLLVLFKTVETQKWSLVLLLSFLTVISTYVLFVIILKVMLPSGWLRIG
jgi:putative tricarboxylic transport membrane protein